MVSSEFPPHSPFHGEWNSHPGPPATPTLVPPANQKSKSVFGNDFGLPDLQGNFPPGNMAGRAHSSMGTL